MANILTFHYMLHVSNCHHRWACLKRIDGACLNGFLWNEDVFDVFGKEVSFFF